MKKIALFCLTTFLLTSCSNDDTSNTRIYIEGQLKSSHISEEILIKLINHEKTISSTSASSNGNFVLSGPYISGDTQLQLSEKVKTFNSNTQGLKISADSLSIIIPSNVSYVEFNEIILVK